MKTVKQRLQWVRDIQVQGEVNLDAISIAVERDVNIFSKVESKGSIYRENKVGPRTGPWGTPQWIWAEEEKYCLIATEKVLSERSDLN